MSCTTLAQLLLDNSDAGLGSPGQTAAQRRHSDPTAGGAVSNQRVLTGRIGTKNMALCHLKEMLKRQQLPQMVGANCRLSETVEFPVVGTGTSTLYNYLELLIMMIQRSPNGLFFWDKTGCIRCKIASPLNSFTEQNILLYEWNFILAKATTRKNTFWYLEVQNLSPLDRHSAPWLSSYHNIDFESLLNNARQIQYPGISEIEHAPNWIRSPDHLLEKMSKFTSWTILGTIKAKRALSSSNGRSQFFIEVECDISFSVSGKDIETSILTAFVHYTDLKKNDLYDELHVAYEELHVGFCYLFNDLVLTKIKVFNSVEASEPHEFRKAFQFVFGSSRYTRIYDQLSLQFPIISDQNSKPFHFKVELVDKGNCVSFIISYKGAISKIVNVHAGIYELDGNKKLYLTQQQFGSMHLGLRVGAQLHIKNVHVIKTQFMSDPDLNTTSFVACEDSTIDIIRVSDIISVLEVSEYIKRMTYFGSWISFNSGDIIIFDYIVNLLSRRGVDSNKTVIQALLTLFGKEKYERHHLSFIDHIKFCTVATLRYPVPLLPSLFDLVNANEIIEWKKCCASNDASKTARAYYSLNKLFSSKAYIIGTLTKDNYGNIYLSNGDISVLLLLLTNVSVNQENQAPLLFNQVYCLNDGLLCIDNCNVIQSPGTFYKSYISIYRENLIPLHEPCKTKASFSSKKVKNSIQSLTLLKLNSIGPICIDENSNAYAIVYAVSFKIHCTVSTSFFVEKISEPIIVLIKVTGKHIATFVTSDMNDTYLADNYEEMESDKHKSKTPFEKAVILNNDSFVSYVRVLLEEEDNSGNVVLNNAEVVRMYYATKSLSTRDNFTSIDTVIKTANEEGMGILCSVIEGVICFTEWFDDTVDMNAQQKINLSKEAFEKYNVGSGRRELFLCIEVMDISTLTRIKIYVDTSISLYPLGFFKGAHIRITSVWMRKSMRTGIVYGTTICESKISILSITDQYSSLFEFRSKKREYLLNLVSQQEHFSGALIRAEVQFVKQVSFWLQCSLCAQQLGAASKGICEQCNERSKIPILCGKAVCKIYDGSCEALLSLDRVQDVTLLLKLSDLQLQCLKTFLCESGVFVYYQQNFHNSYRSIENSDQGFSSHLKELCQDDRLLRTLKVRVDQKSRLIKESVTGFNYALANIKQLTLKDMTTLMPMKLCVKGVDLEEVDYRVDTSIMLNLFQNRKCQDNQCTSEEQPSIAQNLTTPQVSPFFKLDSKSTPNPAVKDIAQEAHLLIRQKSMLSEEERRTNHVESEKKRRQNIKHGFEKLVQSVPTLKQGQRSEAVILQNAVKYIHHLMTQNALYKKTLEEINECDAGRP